VKSFGGRKGDSDGDRRVGTRRTERQTQKEDSEEEIPTARFSKTASVSRAPVRQNSTAAARTASTSSSVARTTTSSKVTKSMPPPPKKKPSSNRRVARVLYDYKADGDDEMTVKADELIYIIEEIDEGWWIGESVDGRRKGMFPANYVEETEEVPQVDTSEPEPEPEPPRRIAPASASVRGQPRMSMPTQSKTSSRAVAECRECGCDDFAANVFRKDNCNNCFHRH